MLITSRDSRDAVRYVSDPEAKELDNMIRINVVIQTSHYTLYPDRWKSAIHAWFGDESINYIDKRMVIDTADLLIHLGLFNDRAEVYKNMCDGVYFRSYCSNLIAFDRIAIKIFYPV